MNLMLLKNGLIYNVETGEVNPGDILIENETIKEISQNIIFQHKDLRIIDVEGRYVLPGFVDCHTHLGIIEEATGKIGVDNNETSEPVTPHLRGIDGINPMDIAFKDAVKAGITCVMSGPGSDNPVGGQTAALKTWGTIIDKMVVRNPAGLKMALGENPISTYGADSKCPVTRMGTAALIRELFMRTQDYMALKAAGRVKERNMRLEAVMLVIKGQIPLRVHAHRADDIVTAIRIAEEFRIDKLVIEHGTEAHMVKEYIKEKKVPVAFGPMLTPRIKMELKRRKYSAVPELVEEGIKVALITDHPYNSIDQLRTVAILAVSEGLTAKDAIKCITTHPAEILECENRIGRLREGWDGDAAVFDGPPMDINSKVWMTIINGRIVYSTRSS